MMYKWVFPHWHFLEWLQEGHSHASGWWDCRLSTTDPGTGRRLSGGVDTEHRPGACLKEPAQWTAARSGGSSVEVPTDVEKMWGHTNGTEHDGTTQAWWSDTHLCTSIRIIRAPRQCSCTAHPIVSLLTAISLKGLRVRSLRNHWLRCKKLTFLYWPWLHRGQKFEMAACQLDLICMGIFYNEGLLGHVWSFRCLQS